MKNIPKPNKFLGANLFIPYYSNSRYLKKNKTKKIMSQSQNNGKQIIKNIKFQIKKENSYNNVKNILSAYEKADIESNILNQIKSKNYQTILQKDKNISYYLTTENKELKKEINKKKLKLKDDLTKIINKSISLANNINSYKYISADKKLKRNQSQNDIRKKNNDFLENLGIKIEFNENKNVINIDIDKAWKYINKISKGKQNNIDDILKQKIVNNILNLKIENGNKKLIRGNSKNSHKNEIKKKVSKIKPNKKEKINNNNRINTSYTPYKNNRLRMIEILNRYICSTTMNDNNQGDPKTKS